MPITHILVIVDDEEGIADMVDVLNQIEEVGDAHLLVTDTVQGPINMLADDGDVVILNRRLNG